MSAYPLQTLTAGQLFCHSLWLCLKNIIWIIPLALLSVVIKEALFYLAPLSRESWWQITLLVINLVLQIYVWAAILLSLHQRLLGQPISLVQSLRDTLKRYPKILSGFIIYCFIALAVVSLCFMVVYLLMRFSSSHAVLLAYSSLISLPLSLVLIIFLLAVPYLITHRASLWRSFYACTLMLNLKTWLRLFVLYVICLLFLLLLSSNTKHGYWLIAHHILFVFDIFMLVLVAPWIMTYLLLLMQNTLRQANLLTNEG